MYTGHKYRNKTDWGKWMEIWDEGERGLSCGYSIYDMRFMIYLIYMRYMIWDSIYDMLI